MNVSFLTTEDYFADMERIHKDGECPLVRAEAVSMKRDEQGGVTDVRVVSGFVSGEHYYELTIHCDEIWAGDKDPEGLKQAREVIDAIKRKCEEFGFGFGGGRWQP